MPRISAHAIADAARALHDAKRIWITGYRSCRSVAELLNYELRLFRPEQVQLVGVSGPDDLDLGAFRPGEAVDRHRLHCPTRMRASVSRRPPIVPAQR